MIYVYCPVGAIPFAVTTNRVCGKLNAETESAVIAKAMIVLSVFFFFCLKLYFTTHLFHSLKELRREKNKLYLAVSIQEVKAGISAQTSGNKSTGLKYAPPTSTISLSEFFKNVNPDDKDMVK